MTRVKWFTGNWLLVLLGVPALYPILCVAPGVFTANGSVLAAGVADVLGTGAEILLFITLLITPLVTITGNRRLIPLRKWYGIMTGVTAVADAVIAISTTIEFGTPVDRVTAHSFLVAGLLMVILLVALLVTANNRSMKWLGKYWKVIQRQLTYAVWALLGLHLVLLFNLGPDSGSQLVHQRVYQYIFCSLPLVLYRIPVIRKAMVRLRKEGMASAVYIMAAPWAVVFILGMAFIVNEEVFKGVAQFVGHPGLD